MGNNGAKSKRQHGHSIRDARSSSVANRNISTKYAGDWNVKSSSLSNIDAETFDAKAFEVYVQENNTDAEFIGGPLNSFGGSLSSVFGCAKNRKMKHHSKYISVENFDVDKLETLSPDFPLDKDLIVSYINSWVPLVVRIHGQFISKDRPDMRDSDTPYVFSNMRGREVSHAGSGWVKAVTGPSCRSGKHNKCKKKKRDNDMICMNESKCIKKYETCEISSIIVNNQNKCDFSQEDVSHIKCKQSLLKRLWNKETPIWTIWILTAKHIIYDSAEARCSHVSFFDDLSPRNVRSLDTDLKIVEKCDFHEGSTEEDWCLLKCYTDDRYLADKLKQWVFECKKLTKKLDQSFDNISQCHTDPNARMVVVISHPHGKKKYLSLGDFRGSEGWAVKYTAGTCSGSSGGLVLNIGRKISYGGNLTLSSCLPHSGAVSEEVGISAAWRDCECNT